MQRIGHVILCFPGIFSNSIFWALVLEKVTTLHLHTVVGYTAYPHYLPIDELLCRAVKSLCRTYQTSKEHTAPHSRKTPHFPESKWVRSALWRTHTRRRRANRPLALSGNRTKVGAPVSNESPLPTINGYKSDYTYLPIYILYIYIHSITWVIPCYTWLVTGMLGHAGHSDLISRGLWHQNALIQHGWNRKSPN